MTDLTAEADAIYQAVRTLNHRTISVRSIPPPDVYKIMSGLTPATFAAVQLCQQLSAGLERSLVTHDVYEDNNGSPAERVALAQVDLDTAARHFHLAYGALNAAWSAVSSLGYRNPETD